MLGILKKRISTDKLSNVYVNSIIQLVEDGFPDVAALINDSPEFIIRPNISNTDSDKFLLIIIAGNIKFIPGHLDTYHEMRFNKLIMHKFAHALGLDIEIFKTVLNNHYKLFNLINSPSKNVLYAMSKSVFYKYNLAGFQEEYFRKIKSPNPIFMKRLNEVMRNFLWDWIITEQYRLVQ